MTMREEFEAWGLEANPHWKFFDSMSRDRSDGYAGLSVQAAWLAWQASRAAALEEAAKAVEQHDRVGREWAPGSFFGAVTAEAAGRIRAIKERE